MRRLDVWTFAIITGFSVSNATEATANQRPSFFKLPDYPTEVVDTETNLFLNPADSNALFDPNKLEIIGLGSANEIDYAFISSERDIFYVKNGDEILPDVLVQNINVPQGIVEIEYKGRSIMMSNNNASVNK